MTKCDGAETGRRVKMGRDGKKVLTEEQGTNGRLSCLVAPGLVFPSKKRNSTQRTA